MDKSRFWRLIDEARRDANPSDQIAPILIDKLAAMEIGEIVRWAQIFSMYLRLSYKNKLWAAAYVINGGCSDDGFDYFRSWLIAQGKEVFMRALADPDSLANVDVGPDEAFYEDMLGVGSAAYFKKTGMAKRDYRQFRAVCNEHPLSDNDLQNLAADIRYAPDIDVKWEENELAPVVPALYAKFR
jgi:hypothetical protein